MEIRLIVPAPVEGVLAFAVTDGDGTVVMQIGAERLAQRILSGGDATTFIMEELRVVEGG